jgi:hypothetical protein
VNARIAQGLAAIGIAAFTALSILPARAQDVLGETGIKGAGSTMLYTPSPARSPYPTH